MNHISTLLCLSFFLLTNAPRPFSQVFLEVDFAGGMLPVGWSSNDISGNEVTWQGCPAPGSCGLSNLPPTLTALTHFKSTTADNGFVAVNSDAAGHLPNDGHISRLSTSALDCSDKSRVFLQFQTAIGTATRNAANNAVLRVMSDAGTQTYRPFSMLEKNDITQIAPIPVLAKGKAYFVTLDITSVAANQPEVYLEWEWKGNFEFAWLIDDILLSTENPARPENAVFYESFDNGNNGWTSNPVFPPDSLWQWRPAGDVGQGFGLFFAKRDAFIHSPSASDGAIAFDADFYNTGGDAPGQAPPNAFVCELISPPIDLSEVEEPLALQFYQLGWLGNLANGAPQTQEGARFITSFAYSNDGGNSWSDPINTNPYQTPVTGFNLEYQPPFSYPAYFPLPKEMSGSSNFRIKFTWAGDFYFWVLDDIAIVKRPSRDMRANRNFFSLTPNAITPVSQLQDETLLCDVVNIGSETAENVRLEAVVRKKNSNTVVYTDTLHYGNILVDSLVENVFFNRKLEALSLQEPGEYEAFYAVGHSQPDARPQDDTVRWRFIVSDFTFAKELGPTRDIAPAESPSYSYGNVFYIPNGQGFYACAASFGIGNPARIQGEDVSIILYEWNGEFDENGEISIEDLEFLSGNTHIINETDGLGLIHLPISSTGGGQPLKDDTYYVLALRYDSFFRRCYLQASDTLDYQATWFVNDSLDHPQIASILDVGNTGSFSTIGFGYNIVPVIRLHLGTDNQCLVSTTEPARRDVEPLLLSPNPTSGWVRLELNRQQAYTQAEITITSLSGQIVKKEYLGNLGQVAPLIDVSALPPGIYTVRFTGREYAGVGRLVVQR